MNMLEKNSMKLTNIKICGIRGFNLEKEINLDEELTMIYGQNAQGKTSFVEAIEWLLFGSIFKKDNAPSKIEYKDTIKNLHFSNEIAYVEAIFKNNQELTKLKREYIDEEHSRFFINDKKSNGISDLGFSDTIRPIIYQHGLKSFIHTEPVGRFKEFMRLLNIDEVDIFFRRARDAYNQYVNDKPKKIRDALLFLKKIEDEQKDYYDFLISNKFDILAVSNKINNELKVIKTEVTKENLKLFTESVYKLTEKIKKEFFNLDLFSPILSFNSIKIDIIEKPEIFEAMKTLVNPDVGLAKNRLDILKNGLEIIKKTKTEECPLCFEKTITKEKIGYINAKYQEDHEFEKQIKQAQKKIDVYLEEIVQWKRTNSVIFKELIINKRNMESCKNLNVENSLLTAFNDKTETLNKKFIETIQTIEFLEKILNNLQDMTIEPNSDIIKDFIKLNEKLKGNFKDLNKIVFDLSVIT